MEQPYIYECEPEDEGITFKKVGYFFKKAWLRLVIYAVVAALLTTAVALPVKVFYKSEPIAQTSIEFIYDGIEKGLDPFGGALDTDNIISMSVLKDAVEEANLGGKIKSITALRESMRVEGVKTDEYVKLVEAAANGDKEAANRLRNYTMFPTRFDIVISDPGKLDLSDDQAMALLDKIVMSYCNDFKDRFSVTGMFPSDIYTESANKSKEFVDIYDMYTAKLDIVKEYLTERATANPTFVSASNNTTFSLLLNELDILKSNYALFNATVLSGNIWRDKALAKSNLEASKIEIQNQLTPLENYITALTEQIKAIQPNTSTSDSNGSHNVTVTYPPEYYIYQNRLDESNRQVRDYQVQLASIETRLTKLEDQTATDDKLLAAAERDLAEIEESSRLFINKVNSTIADYFETTFVVSSVRQVQPPIVTRRSLDFSLLMIYLIAVIAGALAACVVTGIKISKANAKRNAVCEQSADEKAGDDKSDSKGETDKADK